MVDMNGIPRALAPNTLAQQVADLRRRVEQVTSGRTYVSLERITEGNGLNLAVGEALAGTVRQVNGDLVKAGPKPPQMSPPRLSHDAAVAASITWDGQFVDEDGTSPVPAPEDWVRGELYASENPGGAARGEATLLDTIESPLGGAVPVLLPAGVWYFTLVALAASGKRSNPSVETEGEVLEGVTEAVVEELRQEYAESARRLEGALAENALQQGALAETLAQLENVELVALADNLERAQTRLDAADTLLNDTFPKRLQDVETATGAASTAASAASTAASAATTKAAAAQTAAAQAAADLATAKARADAAATAATKAAADATAAEASSTRATGAAGAAEAAADKARQDAAAALTQAQNAGGDVSTAQAAAAAAQTAANTAKTQATAAGTSAAAADAKAAQAAADAAKATADAVKAQASAATAATEATTAKTAATTSATKATAAETAAATAKTRADTAAADAATAKTRADTAAASATKAATDAAAAEASSTQATGAAGAAETAADKARQDAAAALTQAQNAGDDVELARAAATTAQTAANTAKTQATAAGTSAAAADAKAAQAAADAAKATADAAAAKASATTAATEATTAKTAATTATTKATAAETAAATAKTRADTAAADAATAATKATAAESSATKASGSAGVAETAADKARQDAAAALTQAQNSGTNATAAQTAATAAQTAANTAKTQATAAGTSAAAADAKAAQAAADAAKAAADLVVARNAAADARGDADTALGRADSAITMAGSAARVMYSTANPSGTAREGDTWRKTASDAGDVIAEWRYTKVGTAAASWKPQKVTDAMVSNLDIGKLSAGSGTFVQAVAEKMAAATATIQKADIGNLTVTGSSALNTLTAQRIAAGVASFLSVTTDQLTAGSANLGTAVAEKLAAGVGSFLKLTANQVFIGAGGNLIPDPGFTDAALNAGRQALSTGTWTLVAGTATEPAAMRHVMSSANDAFQYWTATPTAATMLKVFPGQVFNLSVDVTTTHSAVTRWNAYLLRADGSVSYTGLTQRAAATGRRELTQEYTIPAGVVGIAFVVACLTNGGTFTVHGNGSATEKITPSLVVDGLMNGKRIVGASVETDLEPAVGVKLDNDGLVAHGEAVFKPVGGTAVTHQVRTILSHRQSKWGASASDKWPGLWFESNPKGSSAAPPLWPAGFTTSSADAKAILGRSAMDSALDTYTEMLISPTSATLNSFGKGSTSSQSRTQTIVGAFETGFNIGTADLGGSYVAQVLHSGDGVLRLKGANGVQVNGQTLDVTKIPPTLVPLTNGFAHFNISGWSGVRYSRSGDIVEVTGAYDRAAAYDAQVVVGVLPAGIRPAAKKKGTNVEVNSAGEVLTTIAGSGPQSLGIIFIL